MLTFAVGDVHGEFAKMEDLMGRCVDYAHGRPHSFVMLGDYIDRGPDSRDVVRRLIRLSEGGNVICLKGNHEDMLLAVIDRPADFMWWINNGGETTLETR